VVAARVVEVDVLPSIVVDVARVELVVVDGEEGRLVVSPATGSGSPPRK
jgi:hypothetical protein